MKHLLRLNRNLNLWIDEMLYHCVAREENRFLIFEEPMHMVNIDGIRNIKRSGNNSIKFFDGINEYLFNISKSTLFKRFVTQDAEIVEVRIYNDPYEILRELFEEYRVELYQENVEVDTIILPLYSMKSGLVEEKVD